MPRPIDHLVLAVRDLDAAASTYRGLGFRVGGRNRHPWGTQNHIVQLDGAFLELVGFGADIERRAVSDPAAPFANTLARFLERREGLAQVALQSPDARADAHAFGRAGLISGEVLQFGRTAEGEDGQRREVAFSLAFAAEPAEAAPEFFACQHHRPENFWAPALQQHPNTARCLLGVVMAADPPYGRDHLLRTLLGPDAVTAARDGITVAAGPQTIDIMHPDRARVDYGVGLGDAGFVAYRVGVASLDAVRDCLERMTLPYDRRDTGLIVGPAIAHGVALSFEPLRPAPQGDVT